MPLRHRVSLIHAAAILLAVVTVFGSACAAAPPYKTQNVFIVVVDGARYSETFGDPSHQFIPHLAGDLAPQGVLLSDFRCTGPTLTNPGHAALTTGHNQKILNNGKELPKFPTLLQVWVKQKDQPKTSAWVIASKDKLAVLAESSAKGWRDIKASQNCGVGGIGTHHGDEVPPEPLDTTVKRSYYRDDAKTFVAIKQVLAEHHPRLVVINFKEPDAIAHKAKTTFEQYTEALHGSDQLVYDLWQHVQADPFYKDKTTVFFTNDHGRHLDGIKTGFHSHGDDCEGCRHIMLVAIGPDFKRGAVSGVRRDQQDVAATAAALLGVKLPAGQGHVMDELFAPATAP